MGHCQGSGTVAGTGATDQNVPLPGDDQLFLKMKAWVEGDTAPDTIVLQSMDKSASQPICVFPRKAVYTGPAPATGAEVSSAANYTCQ